ncbi:hypothetical protein BIY24_07250 [Halobacteriovorax marinus]|nr:hypothetical protein BIY24_07250 [Halobacteriovorax marinus]
MIILYDFGHLSPENTFSALLALVKMLASINWQHFLGVLTINYIIFVFFNMDINYEKLILILEYL